MRSEIGETVQDRNFIIRRVADFWIPISVFTKMQKKTRLGLIRKQICSGIDNS